MLRNIIIVVIRLYSYVMLFSCIMSWIPGINQSQIGQLIYRLTEPVLTPIRRILSRYVRNSMIDWSPLVVFLLLDIIMMLL